MENWAHDDRLFLVVVVVVVVAVVVVVVVVAVAVIVPSTSSSSSSSSSTSSSSGSSTFVVVVFSLFMKQSLLPVFWFVHLQQSSNFLSLWLSPIMYLLLCGFRVLFKYWGAFKTLQQSEKLMPWIYMAGLYYCMPRFQCLSICYICIYIATPRMYLIHSYIVLKLLAISESTQGLVLMID